MKRDSDDLLGRLIFYIPGAILCILSVVICVNGNWNELPVSIATVVLIIGIALFIMGNPSSNENVSIDEDDNIKDTSVNNESAKTDVNSNSEQADSIDNEITNTKEDYIIYPKKDNDK